MKQDRCYVKYFLNGGKWDNYLDICRRVYDTNYICPAITTFQGGERCVKISENYRIRRITPKECWRLMGFYDMDFEKSQSVNSDSQLYKQAGNSIVVNVLMAIFNEML